MPWQGQTIWHLNPSRIGVIFTKIILNWTQLKYENILKNFNFTNFYYISLRMWGRSFSPYDLVDCKIIMLQVRRKEILGLV